MFSSQCNLNRICYVLFVQTVLLQIDDTPCTIGQIYRAHQRVLVPRCHSPEEVPKFDWSANRPMKFEHTFITSESLVSNGENRSSLSPFVLELFRKQSHSRIFLDGTRTVALQQGVTKYPEGQHFRSKSSPKPYPGQKRRICMTRTRPSLVHCSRYQQNTEKIVYYTTPLFRQH